MTNKHEKIEFLFHRASELEGDAQNEFLDRECGSNTELRLELKQLLEADKTTSFILDRPMLLPPDVNMKSHDPLDDVKLLMPHLAPAARPESLGRLDKYEIIERIGRGGMGAVYRAYDSSLERYVAIKIQIQGTKTDDSILARFKREARAVAKLDIHPNIVRVHDFNVDGEPPYIVFELVDGQNLADLVSESGPLGTEEALRIATQVALALAHAHGADVVHRDVKPQNLMLSVDGVSVKVLDLGLARLPTPQAPSRTEDLNAQSDSGIAGSMEFMSPEQTQSLANATHLSDIYSLGCTIFYLVTGASPFKSDNAIETMEAHCNAPRPSLASVLAPDPLIDRLDVILLRMMAVDPADRQQTMEVVLAELNELIDETIQRKRRKRRRTAIASGMLAMTVAIVLVIRLLMPPNYRFNFAGVSDRNEVTALAGLGDQIQQIRLWRSSVIAGADGVPPLIRRAFSNGGNLGSFQNCAIAGNLQSLGIVTAALTQLDHHFEGEIPNSWRTLSDEALLVEVTKALNIEHQAAIRKKLGLLVSKENCQRLLRRWGVDEFPSPSRPSYQDRWLAALQEAIAKDVAPVAAWYATIESIEDIDLNSNVSDADHSVVLSLLQNDIFFNGEQTTAGFRVLVRDTTGDHLTEVDTGLRILDCRLERGDEAVPVTVNWPPPRGVVDGLQFEDYLNYRGWPKAYRTTDHVLSFTQGAVEPCLVVSYKFAHMDIGSCGGTAKVVLDSSLPAGAEYQWAELTAARGHLEEQILTTGSFRGFAVTFSRSQRSHQPEERQPVAVLNCLLELDAPPPMSFIASLDTEDRIVVSGNPSAVAKSGIASSMCKQDADLAGMALQCRLDQFRLESNPPRILCRARFPSVPRIDDGFQVSINPAGQISFDLSAEIRNAIVAAKQQLSVRITQTLNVEDVRSEVASAIHKSDIADKLVDIVAIECDENGNRFTMALSIGDWDEISLGPLYVDSLAEIQAAVKSAIDDAAILAAAGSAWSAEFQHPRFGRSNAKLISCDLRRGSAVVQTTMLLGGGAFPLTFTESVDVEANERSADTITSNGDSNAERDRRYVPWVYSTTQALATGAAGGGIKAFLKSAEQTASDICGIKMRLRLAGPDGQWLKLSPPRIEMVASIELPLPVDDIESSVIELGRITLDQDGLSAPKSVAIKPKWSVFCHYFTASDPTVQFDFATNALALGVKLTPPYPFTHVVSTAQKAQLLSSYGILHEDDIRWDNLLLHAGHLYVQMDGRMEERGLTEHKNLRLGAEGNLIALEDTQIGSGRGEVAIGDWRLQNLRLAIDAAINADRPELGKLNGELTLSPPSGQFEIDGNVELAGMRLEGKLFLNGESGGRRDVKRPVLIQARTHLPIVGHADAVGTTNLSLSDYEIAGQAVIEWPLSRTRLYCIFQAVPNHVKFDWSWKTPDGRTIHYATEAPRLDLIDEESLKHEIDAVINASLDTRLYREDRLLEMALESNFTHDKAPQGFAKGTHDTSTDHVIDVSQEVGYPSVILKTEGDFLVVQTNDPPYEELGRISSQLVNGLSWDDVEIWCGWSPDNNFSLCPLKIGDHGGFLASFHFKGNGEVEREQVKTTPEDAAFSNRWKLFATAEELSMAFCARTALLDAVELREWGYVDVRVGELANGFTVTGGHATYGTVTKTYCCEPSRSATRFTYCELPENELQNAISYCANGLPDFANTISSNERCVVAFDRQLDLNRCAVVTRISRDSFLLEMQTGSNWHRVQIQRIGSIETKSVWAAARRFAIDAWNSQLYDRGTLFAGEAGACFCSDSGDWSCLPTDDHGGYPSMPFAHISKSKLIEWMQRESSRDLSVTRLLPKSLWTDISTNTIDSLGIAKAAVTKWSTLKLERDNRRRWGASPMALLLQCAASESIGVESSEPVVSAK